MRNASISRVVRSMPSRSTSRTSALRRAVDGVAPPLSLQVPGPRGAEEVARAHATATQTPCTHGYVETGRRWCPSRWSRRLVAVPDSSCLQRSSPGRCWSRRRSSLVRRRFDVAAPRFEARPSRRRRRKNDPLHALALFGVDPVECAARTYRVLTFESKDLGHVDEQSSTSRVVKSAGLARLDSVARLSVLHHDLY